MKRIDANNEGTAICFKLDKSLLDAIRKVQMEKTIKTNRPVSQSVIIREAIRLGLKQIK